MLIAQAEHSFAQEKTYSEEKNVKIKALFSPTGDQLIL